MKLSVSRMRKYANRHRAKSPFAGVGEQGPHLRKVTEPTVIRDASGRVVRVLQP